MSDEQALPTFGCPRCAQEIPLSIVCADGWRSEVEGLAAEVERLKAALAKIAFGRVHHPDGYMVPVPGSAMIALARAALGEASNDE